MTVPGLAGHGRYGDKGNGELLTEVEVRAGQDRRSSLSALKGVTLNLALLLAPFPPRLTRPCLTQSLSAPKHGAYLMGLKGK